MVFNATFYWWRKLEYLEKTTDLADAAFTEGKAIF
jgi:hypothetical protein